MVLSMTNLPTKVLVVERNGTGSAALKKLIDVRFEG
jgi:hypothetical protein